MGNVNSLIAQRSRVKTKKSDKVEVLAERSAQGELSPFSAVFATKELNVHDKALLESILRQYCDKEDRFQEDLASLIKITAEVRSINHQAALLHGERIKRGHDILTNYKEGAFTAWMIAAYGNRQTPYNLMQYYEFYISLTPMLQKQIEEMPRQAIYTLASRAGSMEKKCEIIRNYQGETKEQILSQIRDTFPLFW